MAEQTDLQRLVVSLEANIKNYQNQLAKATGQADKSARTIERRFDRMNKGLAASFNQVAGRLGLAFGAGLAIREAQQLIDASTRIQNALKIAGLEGEELNQVYERLFASAQKNAAPFETLAHLYGRTAIAQKELNVSSEELIGFVDKVAVALRVSGKSAAESRGALIQLAQAIGAGIVRAEEFNAILEGALPIAQAAAAGLEEAGGSVAKLRTLVIDGKVSSEAFFRAFEAGSTTLDSKVANATFTVAQGFTQLNNALIDTASKFDDATGASKGAGNALNEIASVIRSVGSTFDDWAGWIAAVEARWQGLHRSIREAGQSFREFLGIAGQRAPSNFVDEQVGDLSGFGGQRTVSLGDFAAPSAKKTGATGGRGGDPFARATAQTEKRIALLNAEAAAIGKGTFEIEKAEAATRLLNAAKEAGMKITPELTAQVEALAAKYGQAALAVEEARGRIDAINEASAEFGSAAADAFKGMALEGKKASEVLDGMLKRLASRGIDSIFDSIFAAPRGGGTSVFGSILGGLFGGFRASGGPVSANRAYMVGERGPEIMVPSTSGVVVPNAGSRSMSGSLSVSIPISINAPGADPAQLARVERSVRELQTTLPTQIASVVKNQQVRGLRP